MKTIPSISLCMILKNEEKNLSACLESVKDFVQEMIIVDTGSTDNTVIIAEQYGAKVYHFEWVNDFSKARNYGLQFVTKEWVLVLDGDERLNPFLFKDIDKKLNDPDVLVINTLREEIGASQSPYSLVSRLFRYHPEIIFNHPYHSMIDDSVLKLNEKEPHWKTVTANVIGIYHYGYTQEAITSLNKFDRAKTAMEAYQKDHPDDPYNNCKLGAIYAEQGKLSQGIKLLKKALKSPNIDPYTLYECYFHLGNAYHQGQNNNEAIDYYIAGLELKIINILQLGAYNNLGAIFLEEENYEKAKNCFEAMLIINPNSALAHYNLGYVLKKQGEFELAIKSYKKAIEITPKNPTIHKNLGLVLLESGIIKPSLKSFKTALKLYREQGDSAEADRLIKRLAEMNFIID